jgi:positive regulator of sigma E activity
LARMNCLQRSSSRRCDTRHYCGHHNTSRMQRMQAVIT